MQKRKPIMLITILSMFLLNMLPIHAQPDQAVRFPSTPLLIAIQGQNYSESDIWGIYGSILTQRTYNHHIYLPIVSPAGDSFAYLQPDSAYLAQALQDNSLSPPTDIYLMSLITGESLEIAPQPDKPSFTLRHPRYTLRSNPVWSPDGKLLAWTEVTNDSAAGKHIEDESLVIYDIATKTTRTLIPKLTAHRDAGNFPTLSDVSFGPNGLIAVMVHVSFDLNPNAVDWLYVYNAEGKQLVELKKEEGTDQAYQYSDLIWLTGFDKPYLSCIACNTKIDPETGDISQLNGTPELYSALAPNKLSLYYGADSGTESNVTWIVAMNGKLISKFDSIRVSHLYDAAISPDGTEIATAYYAGQGSTASTYIYLAQSKKTFRIEMNVLGLGWGPMAWRVHPTPSQ